MEIVRVEQIDGLFNEIFADLLEKLTIIRIGKGVSWMLSSSINLDLDAFLLALLLGCKNIKVPLAKIADGFRNLSHVALLFLVLIRISMLLIVHQILIICLLYLIQEPRLSDHTKLIDIAHTFADDG